MYLVRRWWAKHFANASHQPLACCFLHYSANNGKNIEFSNSMIEAANKQLKYRFLYHKHIADINELKKYTEEAVDDYNNRPHHVLNSFTPLEVLNGLQPERKTNKIEMALAKTNRLIENKRIKCSCFSF